ncbi:MAG: hypothetical protein RDU20_23055 [Desulfomonilaceae bacterium]|nr:hypothetical protein [Desulfomonilaceae bacterium]
MTNIASMEPMMPPEGEKGLEDLAFDNVGSNLVLPHEEIRGTVPTGSAKSLVHYEYNIPAPVR